MNGILTLLTLVLWICNNYIAEYFYPTMSEHDINGYWDLKKVIYSVCIGLIVYSKQFKNTKFSKIFNIIIIGLVLEDIIDRIIFNIKVFEYNDIVAIDFIILLAVIAVTKKETSDDFRNKIFNFKFFNNNRY